MPAVLIPEIVIYNTLNNVFDLVIKDYQAAADKKNSWLYQVFGQTEDNMPLFIGKMNLFEQAVDILVNGGVDKKRKLEISVGYNMQRAGAPTLHIIMPSESAMNAGIGDNEGYGSGFTDESKNIYYRLVTADCSASYSIIVSSDNVNEMLIIYNLLKAIILGFKMQLELAGFKNVTSGGGDLNFTDEGFPPGIFHRGLNINFTYDYSTIDIFGTKYGTGFQIDLKPIPPNSEAQL